MELLTRSVVLLCLVAAVVAKPVSMPERKLLERLLTIIRKILATYKDPPSPVAEPLRASTPGPNRHAHIKAHKPLPAHRNLITVPSNSSDKVCTSGDQCPLNKCCLQVPEAPYATCQPLLRSGQTCSWSHYTQRQPKDIVTRTTCPCFIGLVCIQDFCAVV